MINKLLMKDFMGTEEKTFEFQPGINIITGANHCGKSSVKQAIRYALTAIPDKKEVDEIIRLADGAKCSTAVITNFEGQTHTIEREPKPHKLRLNGVKLEVGRTKEKDGLAEYGYKRNVIQMLCDASNFFELTAKEQADLLMNYFSGDELIDVVKYGISQDEAKDFEGLRASNIKATAENFRQIRYTVNKSIDRAKAEIEIINNAMKERTVVHDRTLEKLEQEKMFLETKLKMTLEPVKFPERSARWLELMDKKKAVEFSDFKAKHARWIAEIVAQDTANKAIISSYNQHSGKCPISQGKITCNEPALDEYVTKINNESAALRAEWEQLNAEDTAAYAKYKSEKAAQLDELNRLIDEQNAKYEAAKAEVERTNLDAMKGMNDLRIQLDGINMALVDLKRRGEAQAKANALAEEVMILDTNSKRYDRYIAFLEKELKEKIVSGNSEGLFETVNEVSRVFNFQIEAVGGDLANIRINGKTPGMLSTSERILCGIALQLAIAKLSGYNFIVVDDMESVHTPYMQMLIRILDEDFPKITSILIGLEAAFPSKVRGEADIKRSYNLSVDEKFKQVDQSQEAA